MTKTARFDFKQLTTDDHITLAIGKVHAQADTLQMNIHRILVAVAQQWVKHGDVRPAVGHVNALLDAMPKGVRSNGIRKWVEVFFGMVLKVDGDDKGKFVAGKLKASDLLMDKLTASTWWTFAPEAPYKPLDFAAELQKLVKKAVERADKTTTGDMIPAELLAGCKALLAHTPKAPAH